MRAAMTKLRGLLVNRGGAGSRKRPLTLRALSDRTGYSIGHLSDVVQGRKPAAPGMVEALARALHEPIARVRRAADTTWREAQHDAA